MEALVQQRLITVKTLKKNFLVMLEDGKHIITSINANDGTATIAKVVIADKIIIGEPFTVDITDITDKVLRYYGKVGTNSARSFDLCYEDYIRAIDGLKEECYTRLEKKNAKSGDEVRITDITVIDANVLYKIEERRGRIVETKMERNKKMSFYVRLDGTDGNLGRTLPLERDSFELLDGDTHTLLHLKCAACEM